MSLLDKLWDDTVAGPLPDSGLGRLRKLYPLPIHTDLRKDAEGAPSFASPTEELPRVTRSIMIRRPAGSPSGTPPSSPATPPLSPFSGSGGREWNRFRKKSTSDTFERSGGGRATAARRGQGAALDV